MHHGVEMQNLSSSQLSLLIEAVQKQVDQGVLARCVPVDWEGKRYWIKIALQSQMNTWNRLQNFAAVLCRVPMLRATVSSSGEEGLKAEASHIKKVASRGALVPEVVAVNPGWILLSDIGVPLFDMVNETARAEEKEHFLMLGANALSSLHNMGGWHGTGQLRDMTHRDGQIGFIDFEENVGEAMSPAAAQARDFMRFIISAVRFDSGDGKLLEKIVQAYEKKAPQAVWSEVRSLLRVLGVLVFLLKPFTSKLGRDLRHAVLTYEALKKVQLAHL